MSKNSIPENGIYDARALGAPKMLVLGIQHMFAMFGATVLVPVLTGLSVSATLLFAGLGTLLFHFLVKGKVPAFLGSSFAFLGGYAAIAPNKEAHLLPYACFGVALAGLMYVLLAALFKIFGTKKVMKFFPPIVTGPIIICIGLIFSSSAIDNCRTNWGIALVAILVVILANIFGKGMIKIIPILLGVVASYLVAAISGNVDFTPVKEAAWLGLPFQWENTVFGLLGNPDLDPSLIITATVTIMPLAIVTMVEPDTVEPFPDVTYTAVDASGFARRCQSALEEDNPQLSRRRKEYAKRASWALRAQEVARILSDVSFL